MSRIYSIVTIFYNITGIDRREKTDNFSQQYTNGRYQPTYNILHGVVVILVTVYLRILATLVLIKYHNIR